MSQIMVGGERRREPDAGEESGKRCWSQHGEGRRQREVAAEYGANEHVAKPQRERMDPGNVRVQMTSTATWRQHNFR